MFEHVTLLLSFVYALALTHLLSSVTELILARDRVRFSLVHALWMCIALGILFTNWLSFGGMRDLSQWTLPEELLQFSSAIIQYFTCSLVSIKVEREGVVDMPAYYARQRPAILAAFAATSLVVIIGNYVDRRAGNSTWIGADLVDLGALALVVLAAVVRPRWLQILIPATILTLLVVFYVIQ